MEKIGPYEIISELGRGGMGAVYQVRDTNLNRIMALKTILPRCLKDFDEKAIQRFIVEGRAIAKLDHPHIVRLYNMGEINGIHYFSMEYIRGETLDDYLEREKPTLEKIVCIIKKIASALHYAHQNGIVHRDLKPANIMIDDKGKPYLTDFGLAKVEQQNFQLTDTHQIIGTPFYMSPEQAAQEKVDHQSDIFSLGTIFYQLLTGSIPFYAENIIKLFYKIINNTPISISKLNPETPEDIERICMRAMGKRKSQRYASALDMENDLDKFLQHKKIDMTKTEIIARLHLRKIAIVIFSVFVLITIGLQFREKATSNSSKPIAIVVSKGEKQLFTAQNLRAQKLYQPAQAILVKMLSDSGDVKIYVIYGELIKVYVELKKYRQAQKYYLLWQKDNASTVKQTNEIYLAMAKMHYYSLQAESARHFLKKISIENTTITSQAFYYRGLLKYDKKEYSAAQSLLSQAQIVLEQLKQQKTYEYSQVLLYMGVCQYKQNTPGILSHTIKILEMARTHIEGEPLLYEYLGRCYKEVGKFEKARDCFLRCIELRPRESAYYGNISEIYMRLEQYSIADKNFHRALAIDPTNIDTLKFGLNLFVKKNNVTADVSQYFFYYMGRIRFPSAPDIFIKEYQQIKHSYSEAYHQWRNLKEGKQNPNFELLFSQIASIKSENAYFSAVKALTSLRYHKQLDLSFEQILNRSISKKYSQNIRQVRDLIYSKRKQELRFVCYYLLAEFYLQPDVINENLRAQKNTIKKILIDPEENEMIRSLAAQVLVTMGEVEFIEIQMEKNAIQRVLCHYALQMHKLIPPLSTKTLIISQASPFIQALAARSIPISDKCFSRNYQPQKDDIYHFLSNKDPRVQLLAAANVLSVAPHHLNNIIIKRAKDIFRRNMQNKDHLVRHFVHHYFWRSPCIYKAFSVYHREYKMALRDSNSDVVVAALSRFFDITKSQYFTEELANLIQTNKNHKAVYLAIFALRTVRFNSRLLNNLVLDQQAEFMTRIFAFASVLFVALDSRIEIANKFGFLMKIMQTNNLQLMQDPNAHFRGYMYCFNSFFGNYAMDRLAEESDKDLQALMLSNLRRMASTHSILKNFSNKGLSIRDKLKVVEKCTQNQNRDIRRLAYTAKVVLSYRSEREQIYQQALKSQDPNLKRGVAVGFYSLLYYQIHNELDLRADKKNPSPEQHRAKYKYNLIIKVKQSHRVANKYIKWLTYAIDLSPDSEFYYERSAIYIASHQYTKALDDINAAIALNDKIRYRLDQIDLYRRLGDKQQAISILNKINSTDYEIDTLITIAKSYVNVGLFLPAEEIAKHIFVRSHYPEHRMLLPRIYAIIRDKKQTIRYLEYMRRTNFIKQRIRNQKPNFARTIKRLREFEFLHSEPWFFNLVK